MSGGISRQLDDQEPGLGRSLAQRLGFSYWDRQPTLPSRQVVPEDYADRVRIILDSIVHRGGAVIVGRGAQLLVNSGHALRVDFVAPFVPGACELGTHKRTAFVTARRLILSGDRERALL